MKVEGGVGEGREGGRVEYPSSQPGLGSDQEDLSLSKASTVL